MAAAVVVAQAAAVAEATAVLVAAVAVATAVVAMAVSEAEAAAHYMVAEAAEAVSAVTADPAAEAAGERSVAPYSTTAATSLFRTASFTTIRWLMVTAVPLRSTMVGRRALAAIRAATPAALSSRATVL